MPDPTTTPLLPAGTPPGLGASPSGPTTPLVPPTITHALPGVANVPYSGFVIVRFKATMVNTNNINDVAHDLNSPKLNDLLQHYPAPRWRRVISGMTATKLRTLEQQAHGQGFPTNLSLTKFWRLDLRDQMQSLLTITDQIKNIDVVENAYPELRTRPATCPPPNDPLLEKQGYVTATRVGIDAMYAWCKANGKGKGVRLVDVELGWNFTHEDLPSAKLKLIGTMSPQIVNQHHGTAVLGIVVAQHNNNLGIAGIAPETDEVVCSSAFIPGAQAADGLAAELELEELLVDNNVGNAIVVAYDHSSSGDIMLIELEKQHPVSFYGGVPVEYEEAIYVCVWLMTALGRVVVEAAGNGLKDLKLLGVPWLDRKDPRFSNYDSGAIMVGGCGNCQVPLGHTIASNWGSRVDCYAWGSDVTTCGYGTAGGTNLNDYYTDSFDASSAASAIVAGAALIVQGVKKLAGAPLTSLQMRTELKKLGFLQANMGHMPDLKKLI